MYLPWPIRPMLDYSRQKRLLWGALKEVRSRSGAMAPVKYALSRAVRGPATAEKRLWAAIDQRWIDLSKRSDVIRIIGDSVPPNMAGRTVLVSEHATNSSTSRPWGDFLFQLIRVIQPHAALELGTCVGFSASYIASAMKLNRKGHLWTLEGMPDSMKIANETFAVLGLSDRVSPIIGRFHDTIDTALKSGPFGFVFIDGHHDGDATIEYFHKIKPSLTGNSIIVFDDIEWSRSMQSAWKHITEDKDIRDSASAMGWGIAAL